VPITTNVDKAHPTSDFQGEVGQTFNYFSLGFTGVKRKSSNNQGD
jgi:hypothetical protein